MSSLESRRNHKIKRKIRRRWLLSASLVCILVLALVSFANRSSIRAYLDSLAGNDFSGNGKGSVTLVITKGETGAEIAQQLVDKGVVKDLNKVYKTIVSRNQVFFPGTYRLRLEMSSQSALDLLADPKSLVVNRITIKEGLRVGQVFEALSKGTGIKLSDFEAYLHNPQALGLPASESSIEGWLFPATYSFDPGDSAKTVLNIMSSRMLAELDRNGVSVADRHRVLTLASIIQKEARNTSDFYKVSRTFQNRLAINMPLQSDATVSYGSGGTTVTTTDAERADPNLYNTYVHTGLPVGPISAPGSTAIDAAIHPAKGDWLYFCAVNLATGETVFSKTISEHEAAVARFRAWIQANPGWNG